MSKRIIALFLSLLMIISVAGCKFDDTIIPGQEMPGITMYHFNTGWTTNYGKSEKDKLKELEDVLKSGYCNTLIIGRTELKNEKLMDLITKNNISFWVFAYYFYKSSDGTVKEWMKQFAELDNLKSNKKLWDLFLGFHHEENIWRNQSNADFLTSTKALYEKYHKRNFVVCAVNEFTEYTGSPYDIEMNAENVKKINPNSLAYITDIGFDHYSVDVREGYSNGGYIGKMSVKYPQVVDGKSYYKELTNVLLGLVGHDANVWYFPCAYTNGLWGGGTADEQFCLSHLTYFDELLSESKYQGGICLYTYQQFRDSEVGLQSHLVVEDKNGKQLLRPEEEKWKYLSHSFKELTQKYKNTRANLAPINFE